MYGYIIMENIFCRKSLINHINSFKKHICLALRTSAPQMINLVLMSSPLPIFCDFSRSHRLLLEDIILVSLDRLPGYKMWSSDCETAFSIEFFALMYIGFIYRHLTHTHTHTHTRTHTHTHRHTHIPHHSHTHSHAHTHTPCTHTHARTKNWRNGGNQKKTEGQMWRNKELNEEWGRTKK